MINTGKFAIHSSPYTDSASLNDLGGNTIVNGENDSNVEETDDFGRRESKQHNARATSDQQLRGRRVPAKLLRAYMLYLRESTTRSGSVVMEHIQSSRARPSKYDKYLAPPALHLPGSSTTNSQQRGTTTTSPLQLFLDIDEEYSSELVIWPECWTNLIDSLQPSEEGSLADDKRHGLGERSIADSNNSRKKKYQIAIWWLSVNNNKGQFTQEQFAKRRDVLHLVQSAYAREYVMSKLLPHGVKNEGAGEHDNDDRLYNNLLSLTEFIPYSSPTFSTITSDDINNCDNYIAAHRDVDVVYNPAKGMHYTDEIIRRMCGGASGKKARTKKNGLDASGSNGGGNSIQFAPIGKGFGGQERMTGEEVVDLLRRSKVVRSVIASCYIAVYAPFVTHNHFSALFFKYIDFGPHPGMDRLPREAALAGCVVITNCEGAANFEEDIPLPPEFKFPSFDVEKICQLLRDCCNNHAAYVEKMKPYREWIFGQEKQMKHCVDQLVDTVVTRRVP